VIPHLSERGLILAPAGRDAEVAVAMLAEAHVRSAACSSLQDLVAELEAGAGFAVVTEEALRSSDLHPLASWINAQPEWSDFPFILLTRRGGGLERNPVASRLLQTLGNVTFLERPFHPTTLVSLAQAAIRGRRRQYDARARLEALHKLNETLEARVDAAVTERLKGQERLANAENALHQAQKMEAVGQLTGGVAHDFNNLLMAFQAGLRMLDRTMTAEQRQRIVEGMQKAIERGATLTRQLLAFSRRRPLESRPLDLEHQLTGMRELLQRSLRGNVQVEIEFNAGLWPVEADPGELELAVLNLCVNARDAMPAGGVIRIATNNRPGGFAGVKGDAVTIAVSDTGTGMPQEVIARVFEPFFTTKEVGKGSGLGLAQVYAFVTQSGGNVGIDSQPGRGTTVTLTFPRSAAQPRPEESAIFTLPEIEHEAGPEAGNGSEKKRNHVLFVEDDKEVAALTIEMLDNIGYKVTHVTSPAAALGALANGRAIDLVFSDVMMPGGMSGVELALEIRKRRPSLPIVLATGYIEAARGAVAEGLDVLVKPYQLETLAQTLNGHLAQRH
jgi:signal transduction histidine kinase/CheY-like chemotaxis protein